MMFATIAAMGAALLDPAAAAVAQPARVDATVTTPDRALRYCVVDTITGSRVPRRECHTRTEWLDQGFDPLAKRK